MVSHLNASRDGATVARITRASSRVAASTVPPQVPPDAEVAELVEDTGVRSEAEVAELVEATGATAGPGPFDKLRDLRRARWPSRSKPPGPASVLSEAEVAEPVEATGVTAGPGPFDKLRDLGERGG
ncbi:hypothetical protein CHE218_13660 [Microbacterium sp. che218]